MKARVNDVEVNEASASAARCVGEVPASSVRSSRVPTATPWAPAARIRCTATGPSTPPAPITGRSTAVTTWRTSSGVEIGAGVREGS